MPDKRKILLVSHSSTLGGGAELCFIEQLKVLELLKTYELYTVFPIESGELISKCNNYAKTYTQYLPQWIGEDDNWKKKIKRFINIVSSIRKSIQLIKKIQPDIIITNTSVIPQYGLASKISSIKHIWFIHELVDESLASNFMFGKYISEKIISCCSDILITNSKFVDSYYESTMKNENRRMLYQPIEIETFALEKESPKTKLTLLIMGKIAKFKGQIEAVLATKELLKREIDVELLIVGSGDGEYFDKLQEIIINNDMQKNVRFFPFTNTPSLYYQKSDIVLVCSQCEALGRVTVESMKMGLPVIVSDRGGNLELVQNGVNGYLYKYGNPIDLANKIMKLQDKGIRKKLGKNGKKWANENFNIEKFTKEFDKILKSL